MRRRDCRFPEPRDAESADTPPDGSVAFRVPLAAAVGQGERYRLGIRPHRIRLGEPQGLPATVLSNQWLGDQLHLALDLGGCFLVAVAHRRIDAPVDSSVAVTLPPAAMHLFDAGSGTAVLHGLQARAAAAA